MPMAKKTKRKKEDDVILDESDEFSDWIELAEESIKPEEYEQVAS